MRNLSLRNMLLLVIVASVLGPVPSALAAGRLRPVVSTGAARSVAFSTAALTGTVNPRGSATSYYFQYGLTRALGAQTAPASAGAGNGPVRVASVIGSLTPITPYYYRLVAVSDIGATIGAERTFVTTKVPLSLQIGVAPSPVIFPDTSVVQGTLSGTDNANRQVILQVNVWPFTGGFVNAGNPEDTLSNGSFVFTLGQTVTSAQFRVVTTSKPAVVSPVVLQTVTWSVSAHVKRARRAHRFRIEGKVNPALSGSAVEFIRTNRGRNVVVGHAVLRHGGFESRALRVKRGVFRALVFANGPVTPDYSNPMLIR